VDARNSAGVTLTMPSDREIVMTRVFDAPCRLVFEAWTKPEHVVRWFGCKSAMELHDAIFGASFAMLNDPFGHRWWLTAPLPQT
jgi:uncharacterized protein YndB with AHSA1/START domain